MSYPIGYDAEGLKAIVTLFDKNGFEQFRWEDPNLFITPVQDFKLVGTAFHRGINSDSGFATLLIDDRDFTLLDQTTNRRSIKIRPGWELEIRLGKDLANLSVWFAGVIQEPSCEILKNNSMIIVQAIGWGIIASQKFSRMQRSQEKLPNGLDPNPLDNSTKISELFKDVFTDVDHLALPGSGQIGITTDNVDDIELKLTDFNRQFQSLGMLANELAEIGGAIYGISPFKDAFLHLRSEKSSGFLITNDTGENKTVLTKNWNQKKILFTRSNRFTWRETIIDSGITVLFGLGSQIVTIDHNQVAANALLDLSTNHYAFPFIPTKDNIAKIALFLRKTGVPGADLFVSIVGAVDNTNNADPNPKSILKSVRIPKETLITKIPNILGEYLERQFDKIPVTLHQRYFILLTKYNDAINPISIDYQAGGGGEKYYQSSDGISWTEKNGAVKFRIYNGKTATLILQNTVAQKSLRPKEGTVDLRDFPEEDSALNALLGSSDILSQIKRLFDPVVTSTPTDLLPMGETVRLIDVETNMDTELLITGCDVVINALDDSNRGAINMTINLEDWFL